MSDLFPGLEPNDRLPEAPATGPEPGLLGVFGASFDAESVRADSFNLRGRRRGKALRGLLEDVYGPTNIFDQTGLTPDDMRLLASGRIEGRGEQAVQQMFDEIERRNATGTGDFANAPRSIEDIDQLVRDQLAAELEASERVVDRRASGPAGFGAEFIGGAAGSISGPDVMLLPLGAGAGTLGRQVLIEGGLGAAGEALSLPAQVEQANELGIDQPSPLTQIAAGALFAGSLPIAARAVRDGAAATMRVSNRMLVREAGARAASLNPTERGAVDQLTAEEATTLQNPGIPPRVFERDLERAAEAVQSGDADALPDTPAPRDAVRPKKVTPPRKGSVARRIVNVESRGKATAANPNSSAFGAGQFIAKTWLGIMKRHRPDLIEGKSEAEILAMRADPDLSLEMTERYAQEGRAFLGRNDLPLHDGAVYLHHFAGPGGAKKILTAADDTPIGKLMSRDAIDANADVKHNGKRFSEFTARDLVDWSKAKMGLASGNIDDYPVADRTYQFDPFNLRTDAETFQYKLHGDEDGVTDRLLNEIRWDADAAMGVLVYERADGMQFIADGHQRLGLAQRLSAAGETGISLEGHLYREADGWTPQMVRLKAAIKNMRAETGSALDAAKILRDNPEIRSQMSFGRSLMAQADGLSKMTPDTFEAVVNGVIPQHYAAVVGRIMPGDQDLQQAALELIRRADPDNLTQVEHLTREVRRLGLERRDAAAQGNLFGEAFEGRETRVIDRARVLDAAIKDLRADKKLFDRLNKDAEVIEEIGNRVQTQANQTRQASSQNAIEAALILADRPGPIRDALDAAAGTARSRNLRAAVSEFTDALRSAVESGDAKRSLGRLADDGAPDPNATGRRDTAEDIHDELNAPEPPLLTSRPDFADPVNGKGPRAEVEVLSAEIEQTAEAMGDLFDAPMSDGGPSARELLKDLEADGEFIDQLALCAPKGGAA